MMKLYKIIEKHSLLFILGGYLLINLLFNYSFWHELLFDNSKVGARYAEVFTAEWAMNKVYQNIISGRNPFAYSNAVLYPFETNFTTTDSGNGFFFVFLRPFLSEHQSLAVIVAVGLFFANCGMYLLLRKLGISKVTSFLIGLAFGYMTFLMPRVGHLNYMSIYVFPWFYFFALALLNSKKGKAKIFYLVGLSITFVMALFLNLYYFVMLVLSVGFFLLYFILFQKGHLFSSIRSNWKYFIGWLFLTVILLYPWFTVLLDTKKFEDLPKTEGWGGAIGFSSDLFGYFIPSKYSYFMHPFTNFLGSHFSFVTGIFEGFTYPGILILLSYLIFFIFLIKKKLPTIIGKRIFPFFFISICFWILTLGPFLHVFGKWGITVDEGIRIVFPLPYIVFHYIPFLANIRVPGRLIVGFIFFAYITCAYLFDYFLQDKTKKIKTLVVIIFILVFLFDHSYKLISAPPHFIPYSAYKVIEGDPNRVTVMEAPSVVRDGFIYFGSTDAVGFIEGQFIHKKPVLAGYLGRISPFKMNYYKRNPFLGYLGRLMDDDLKQNGGLDKSDLSEWRILDIKKSIDSINFLDLKYFLLDDNRSFAGSVSGALTNLGFKKTLTDNYFSLWQRNPEKKEYLSTIIGSPEDDMFLGSGWNQREGGFRWTWNNVSVIFKVATPRKFVLNFQASAFYRQQKVKIYVNKKEIAEVIVPTHLEKFSIPINQELNDGINFIHFLFSDAYRPSEIMPGNKDNRLLSAKFTKIDLKEDLR